MSSAKVQKLWITLLLYGGRLGYNYYYNMQTIFISKIIKVGTSVGIVIPVEILSGLKWQRGDFVIFGFAGTEQVFIKRLTDVEISNLKPKELPNE